METNANSIIKHFSISLDLKKSVSNNEFEVVEGDTDNYVSITLTDEGEPVDLTGYRVVAVFSHSGGAYFQDSDRVSGGISISNNVIELHLHTNSFRRGIVECELRISGDSKLNVSTTPTFNFSCRAPLISDSTLVSDMRFPLLSTLLQQTDDALSAANTAISAASNLPRLHIMYSDTDPLSIRDSVLTSVPSQYMGFCYTSEKSAPTSAKEYTWINTDSSPSVASGALSGTKLTLSSADGIRMSSINLLPLLDLVQLRNLYFTDVTVSEADFSEDSTYPAFPYKAVIICDGVIPNMHASVTFSLEDTLSANYAPIAQTGLNTVTIYCKLAPTSTITIPLIKAEHTSKASLLYRDADMAEEMT